MKRVIAILFFILLVLTQSIGQVEQKKIKRQIPVKRISLVQPLSSSNDIYLYYAKSDTGLWDLKSNTILISHLKNVAKTPFKESWISYETTGEYGIFDLNNRRNLAYSHTPIFLDISSDPNLINIINSEILGFLDLRRDQGYWSRSGSPQDTILFYKGEKNHKCFYKAESNSVMYGYGDPGQIDEFEEGYVGEEFIRIYHDGGFAWESGKVYNLNSGKLLLEFSGTLKQLNGHYVENNRRSKSYYDKNFNLLFKNVKNDKYEVAHFQYFCDSAITEAEYVDNSSIYLCKSGQKHRFYSTLTMQPVSEEYDFTFPVGIDHANNGYSFFTVKEGSGYGLFNSAQMEVAEPRYSIIEKRAFPDGTYWYRADETLVKVTKFNYDSIESRKWNPSMEETTSIITHLGTHGNKLVVSLRSTSADTHDSQYYTATNFDPGSGVIDLKDTSWHIRPEYHSITPYKEHFVAMKIGSTYRNASWLQTTIFNSDFMPATNQKFGVAFVFNDMLIIRQGNNYIEYDVEKQRVIRDLGVLNEVDADFEIVDGYLVVGDYNYETRTKALYEMDISDIITPVGQLVKLPKGRYRFVEMLGEDLVTIGRIQKDEPSGVKLHEQEIYNYAIMDLNTGNVISPWHIRIVKEYPAKGIFCKLNNDSRGISIPLKKVRSHFLQ